MFSTDYRVNVAVIVRQRKFMSVIGQVNFSQVMQVWAPVTGAPIDATIHVAGLQWTNGVACRALIGGNRWRK
jgi:hypothetical protein